MAIFRLTQISDSHLSSRLPAFTGNFDRVSAHIDATRPDLVINSGDLGFDGPVQPDDLTFARARHDALPVECRYLPGNHDIGDNPTRTAAPPPHQPTDSSLQSFRSVFGDDRWHFDAAGWRFIGLNSLIMNTGLPCEEDQFDWLAAQLAGAAGRPLALFIHKPLYRDRPHDEELAATAFRYVPVPARNRLLEMLGEANLRLVASGHVHQQRDYTFRGVRHIWAPSTSFVISDDKQERIGVKEVGLVEYTFQPDGFEVRFTRAPGQTDLELYATLGM